MTTVVPEFDLIGSPIDGRNLIEAGAGTGKTYAISRIVLRLVLEKKIDIGKIAVVTFTEAAAEELRNRIRTILHDAKIAFTASAEDETDLRDPLLNSLRLHCDKKQSLDLLDNALRDFHNASLFTIHGFCRRLLFENAFESDQRFDSELVTDQSGIVREIVEDFWRNHFLKASLLFAAFLMEKKMHPHHFSELVELYINHHDPVIIPSLSQIECKEIEKEFIQLFDNASNIWRKDSYEIIGILNSMALDSHKYNKKSIMSLVDDFNRIFSTFSFNPLIYKNIEKMTRQNIEKAIKKGFSIIKHQFFDTCDSLYEKSKKLCFIYENNLLYLKSQLLLFLNQELTKRKDRQGILFFDDLLLRISKAICIGKKRDSFLQLIRKKYVAALIDEFQDTDPIQYSIFSTIFASGSILFLIGDPKQAIYGFRGADIFAYLKASKNVDRIYTLSKNYRSDKKIVQAVNTIFGNKKNPFAVDEISFQPISSPELTGQNSSIVKQNDGPFIFWMIGRKSFEDSSAAPVSKTIARQYIIKAIVSEIYKLLGTGERRKNQLRGRALTLSDIAVLVRTNREAEIVYNMLKHNGIPATTVSTGNIFNSSEAKEMYRLLLCMKNPTEPTLLHGALSTIYFGYNAFDINQLNTNQEKWDNVYHRINKYNELWKEHGFMQMIRFFMVREKIGSRLIALPFGERKLSNVLQIMELIGQETIKQNYTIEKTCNWLSHRIIQSENAISDQELLWLETDEQAVRVLTLHKSKGLEFPVVFCPFCWEGSEFFRNRKNLPYIFNDPDDNYLKKIALGNEEIQRYRSIAEFEQLAENIRLLYVGLTRAKSRCYCVWGMISSAETSALAYLLHGSSETSSVQALGDKLRRMTDEQINNELHKLALKSDNTITINELPADMTFPSYAPEKQIERELTKMDLSENIPQPWSVTSYSKLINYDRSDPVVIRSEGLDNEKENSVLSILQKPSENTSIDMFSFPKGAKSGSLLHDILQQLDFSKIDSRETDTIIEKKIDDYGFERIWNQPIKYMLRKLVISPLIYSDGEIYLQTIGKNQYVQEMEFYFPLKHIIPKQLNDILYDMDLRKNVSFNEKASELNFSPKFGFVRGFIDLVIMSDGKCFLIDWKSNYLGPSIEDYNLEAIKKVMLEEKYDLQYALYSTALHIYLSRRRAHYNYQSHFGGVFYIFLRGINPEKGPDYGIFFNKPEEKIITALVENLIEHGY